MLFGVSNHWKMFWNLDMDKIAKRFGSRYRLDLLVILHIFF